MLPPDGSPCPITIIGGDHVGPAMPVAALAPAAPFRSWRFDGAEPDAGHSWRSRPRSWWRPSRACMRWSADSARDCRRTRPPSRPPRSSAWAAARSIQNSEAVVRTLVGGVVTRLSVDIGASVVENQEIARVRAPDGSISIVTAPWRGAVTNLPIHNGDTVSAGSVMAVVGDMSRLRVETDDVDEFMVARIRPGQPVTVTVDAIEGRELHGRVRTVALRSQETADGDDHYPVVVDLDWSPPEIRPGMTVRVHFPGRVSLTRSPTTPRDTGDRGIDDPRTSRQMSLIRIARQRYGENGRQTRPLGDPGHEDDSGSSGWVRPGRPRRAVRGDDRHQGRPLTPAAARGEHVASPTEAAGLALKREAQEALDAVAAALAADGLNVTTRVVDRQAESAILEATADEDVSLVVMSTHGRGGLGRFIYGSVADTVLRHAPVPVLTVPPHGLDAWPPDQQIKILVPLDGSDLSKAALAPACDWRTCSAARWSSPRS